MTYRNRAFSLIELLVVIVLIAVLAAMLFPVFAQAREKARQSTCSSNTRQIGVAIALYAADYDDHYPFGLDPVDKFTDAWKGKEVEPILAKTPFLQTVLFSYTKNNEIWRCPSDTGFDTVEEQFDDTGRPFRLNARPTAFTAFGTSYLYRTELTFKQVAFPASGYDSDGKEHSPAEVNVLMDAHGDWHGDEEERRYQVLFADGHTRFCTSSQLYRAWDLKLEK